VTLAAAQRSRRRTERLDNRPFALSQRYERRAIARVVLFVFADGKAEAFPLGLSILASFPAYQ
jgi:hypothetical protein